MLRNTPNYRGFSGQSTHYMDEGRVHIEIDEFEVPLTELKSY